MPKKIGKCFYEKLTFENLLSAHKRSRKNKAYKHEVIEFEMNLENNLINILNNLKNGTYRLGKYRSFIVYEPKLRVINSLPYTDRIVHQWYVEEFIKPYFLPRFINSTYACIPDGGTHKAVDDVQRNMRIFKRNYGDFWILKCDVRKFFYSINPDILYGIMQKHMKDKALLSLTKILIYNPEDKDAIGIPIGNYTSQFFANIYLNELDQHVKHTLKIRFYTRYMDDFVILLKTKEECIKVKKQIEDFLYTHLKLFLNDKSRYYPYKMGVNFCGYRIHLTHRLLRTNNKKKIKKQVKKFNKLYDNNRLDLNHAMACMNSWIAHSSHCNSYNLQQKIIKSAKFIFSDATSNNIQNEVEELTDSKLPNLITYNSDYSIRAEQIGKPF